MSISRFSIILTGVLLFSGCAEMEVTPGKESHLRNAPVNEKSRAGIVSYSQEALDEEGERQEAYDAMAESCHGPYQILKEEVKDESEDFIALGKKGDYLMSTGDSRVYITFRCL